VQRLRQPVAGPQLEHRLVLELAPRRAHLQPARQIVVERHVAKALLRAGLGERVGQLRAVHPAFLAAIGAHLEPVGGAQLHLDPLVAPDHEEDRKAPSGACVQFEVGIGHAQSLGRIGRARGWCAQQAQHRDGQACGEE